MKKKNKLIILSILILAFVALSSSMLVCTYASDSESIVLTVKQDGVTVKEYTLSELEAIYQDEGEKTYCFSVWNTYPVCDTIVDAKGPTVKGILQDAGVYDAVSDDCLVYFSDSSYSKALTGAQLFTEKRYYYPNLNKAVPGREAATDSARYGKEEVPAIINLFVDGTRGKTKLMIGQVEPNEENNPIWVSYIAQGGYINVTSQQAKPCVSVGEVSSTHIATNQEILFTDFPNKYDNLSDYPNDSYYDKVYYSFDGEDELGYGSAIYNNGPQGGTIAPPIINKEGKYTLYVKVTGYGKLDSEVKSIDLNICNGTLSHSKTWGRYKNGYDIYKCSSCDYTKEIFHNGTSPSYVRSLRVTSGKASFRVNWRRRAKSVRRHFTGYQIRYSTRSDFSDAEWKTLRNSSRGFGKSKLESNTTYYVQIRSFVTTKGNTYYSAARLKKIKTK